MPSYGSNPKFNVTTLTSSSSPYSMLASDGIISCDCTAGPITINLIPSSGNDGYLCVIEKTDSTANAVTVNPNGTDKINGAASFTLSSQYQMATLSTDGLGNWENTFGGSGTFLNPMTTLGDMIYENATPTAVRLPGDTSNTRKFLMSLSAGGIAQAPVWALIVAGDIPATLNPTGFGVSSASQVPLYAQGVSGQTANLQEWRNSAGTALAVVGSSGFIGVGTTSPPSGLYVKVAGDAFLGVESPNTNAAGFNFFDAGGAYGYMFGGGSTYGSWGGASSVNVLNTRVGPIVFFTNAAERMRILGNGNVGIGTNSPLTTLQVAGGFSVAVATKTANYTLTASDYMILVDTSTGNKTITLPPASNVGQKVVVVKNDGSVNTVNVAAAGTDMIELSSNMFLTTQNSKITLIAGGNGIWYDLGSKTV